MYEPNIVSRFTSCLVRRGNGKFVAVKTKMCWLKNETLT
jgi:hypothetical protein